MNRYTFLAILLAGFMLMTNCASAITSNMKDTYAPGETAIVEISGNILEPILPENVKFLRGHVSVPFDYDLKKIGEKYYLWANMPFSENNYTLVIEDVSSMVSGNLEKTNYEKNFSVSGNITDYSVKPGIIFTNSDFEITVQLNGDAGKEISIDFPAEQSIELNPGENKLKFSISGINGTSAFSMNVGKYTLPVYIIKNATRSVSTSGLEFIPKSLKRTILLGTDSLTYPIELKNSGSYKIYNISIIYDQYVFSTSPQTAGKYDIERGASLFFNLTLRGTSEKTVRGVVYADSENISVELPVDITLAENSSELPKEYKSTNESKTTSYYCSELQGYVCATGQGCSGNFQDSIEGRCCISGICTEKPGASYAWIGYLIAVLVLAGAIWMYIRYRKARPEKNILEKNIGEGKENKKFEFKKKI